MDDAELIAAAELSPCMGVCKSDDETGWCFGCGRTKEQIKGWNKYDEAHKAELLEPLAERVQQLLVKRKAERGGGKSGGRRGRTRPA
ncbi:MAG: DUF1289 domain-containing protein [Oceanospirillaceae bacterium]